MRRLSAALAALLLLTSCATVPQGPTVAVMPARNKAFSTFQDDQVVCKQFASTEVSSGVTSANTMEAGIGLVSMLLGGGLGAAIGGGHGAAIGAGAGALGGAGVGAVKASKDQGSLQTRYDVAYSQCMATRGNNTSEGKKS